MLHILNDDLMVSIVNIKSKDFEKSVTNRFRFEKVNETSIEIHE